MITLEQFRSNPDLVAQWKEELKNNGVLKLAIEAMESSHPARYKIDGDNNGDISPTRAGVELGTTRGYSMYADRFTRVLATPTKKSTQQPETTYEKEESNARSR